MKLFFPPPAPIITNILLVSCFLWLDHIPAAKMPFGKTNTIKTEQSRANEIFLLHSFASSWPREYEWWKSELRDGQRKCNALYKCLSWKPDFILYLRNKRQSKKKNKEWGWRRRRERKKWSSFLYTLAMALFIDCALYLKIRPELLCTPCQVWTFWGKWASQPQFKSRLTSWPSNPYNLKPLETHTNVNDPPQDTEAQPALILPPTCIIVLSSIENLLLCFKIVVKVSATVIWKCWVTGSPYSELACARLRQFWQWWQQTGCPRITHRLIVSVKKWLMKI